MFRNRAVAVILASSRLRRRCATDDGRPPIETGVARCLSNVAFGYHSYMRLLAERVELLTGLRRGLGSAVAVLLIGNVFDVAIACAVGVWSFVQMRQAFDDDFGRLHRRLAQFRILDDFALHARAFADQIFASPLEQNDKIIDLLQRTLGYLLRHCGHMACKIIARRPPPRDKLAGGNDLANFPF